MNEAVQDSDTIHLQSLGRWALRPYPIPEECRRLGFETAVKLLVVEQPTSMFALLCVEVESGGDVKWRVKAVRKNGGGVTAVRDGFRLISFP